jgi:dTMP kinase
MARGRFLTLEGIEGAGKSTQLPFIAGLIREAGHDVEITREPGGTDLAEGIRQVLMGKWSSPMPATTELLLMFAARASHLREKILPALEAGRWVVCDRFTDASYAYQSAGRGIPSAEVAALETLVQGKVRPDLVILFDLPVQAGLARARGRRDNNRFEDERAEFFERVRRRYLERASADSRRYAVIDAAQPASEVQAQIRTVISGYLQVL